jgi:hypothetical protein
MLVTLAECGESTFATYGSPFNSFTALFQNPVYQALFADPVTNKLQIETYLRSRININYPGAPLPANRRYMDTLFSAQLHHVYNVGDIIAGAPTQYPADPNQKYDIYRSGLYRAGSIDLRPQLKNINEINTQLHMDLNFMYPPEVLYPNRDDVAHESHRLRASRLAGTQVFDAIGIRFQITQRRLFEMFPGVHYLVTCRVPCTHDPLAQFHVGLRRLESRNATPVRYTHVPTVNYANVVGRTHQGQIGQRYILPRGVRSTNYLYQPNRRPRVLNANVDGSELIEIVPTGGARRRRSRVKRRFKGTRKNRYTRK